MMTLPTVRVVDAHRHGLWSNSGLSALAVVPVEQWHQSKTFIRHENFTKTLSHSALRSILAERLLVDNAEGVGLVVDYSGKSYGSAIQEIYAKCGIEMLPAVYWSKWHKSLDRRYRLMILPDERGLNEHCVVMAKAFLANNPNRFISAHCMESSARANEFKCRYGKSTVAWLAKHGLLGPQLLLVHLNCVDHDDLNILVETKTKVVWCPSARKVFHNPSPPYDDRLCQYFGTDAAGITSTFSLRQQAELATLEWIRQGMPKTHARELAAEALIREL